MNNPKLNSVLYKENKNIKYKPINFYFPIRNYNSLNKNRNNNKSLNSSRHKVYNEKENSKKYNNSYKEKEHNNKYFDSTKLKNKLKKNKSIEKGYTNFYKIDRKLYNNRIYEKKININKTVIQNYMYPIDNGETNNNTNSTSFSKEIEIKSDINNSSKANKSIIDLLKLKLDKLNNYYKNNEPKTERENIIKIKDKTKNSILKICSKSAEKRNRRKKMIINVESKKEKNNFIKLSDIAEKYAIKKSKNKSNNSKINKKSKKLKDINNNKKENNIIDKKKGNIIMIKENYNTLPKTFITNSEIFDSQINKKNSNEIFEVISDVKVKSFIEYEEDKKNLLSKKESKINIINNKDSNDINKKENKLKNINDNIKEISIIKNYMDKSADKMNYSEDSNSSEKFIEDRDEYNIKLKETFSKDRFSFRPTNKDSKETFQDNKYINDNNKLLDKKDFLNNDKVSSNIKYCEILPNSITTKKIKNQIISNKIKIMKKRKKQGLKTNK